MDRRLEHIVIFFFVGMLMIHGYVFWSVRDMVIAGYPDFTSFYGAGKSLRDGRGAQLYDAGEQWRVQQEFASRVRIRNAPLPYLRPPFEALLFVPLTLLPYSQAYLLWNAAGLCIALGIPLLLRRRIQALRQFPSWLLVMLPLAFTPLFLALIQGQDSILLLLFYSLAYLALTKAEDFRAGCWLGLGLFKPQLIIPFAAILLLQGKRRVVLGFFSVAGVLFFVSVALVGWSEIIRYPGYVWSLEQHTGREVLPRDTPNLRGLVEGFCSGLVPTWAIILLVSISSVAVVVWAARRHSSIIANGNRITSLVFSQAMVATFLVSYHAFGYDLIVMLLPIFLLIGFVLVNNWRASEWSDVALTGPIALLLFAPIFLLLWLPFHAMNLVAMVLLLWMWGMSRKISQLQGVIPPAQSGTHAIGAI